MVSKYREILADIIPAPESRGERGLACRLAVFTHCVELLNSDQLQSQTAQELVGKLLIEVSS